MLYLLPLFNYFHRLFKLMKNLSFRCDICISVFSVAKLKVLSLRLLMKTFDELKYTGQFISEYATSLLGSGVHTSRVIRNSKRLGESLGLEVRISSFQKTMTLSVYAVDTDLVYTEVVEIPALPINFEWNSELSALSWQAHDHPMTIEELKSRYREIVAKPKMRPEYILLLVAFANASFCRLFGGDWAAMGVIFFSTLAGFFTRQQLLKRHVNHLFVFIVCSFIASICASTAMFVSSTAEIALATSVLFLIPGVPLINGVIDIVEGYTLIGTSRIINAILLIISLSAGLYFTLLIVKDSLL